MVEIGKERPHSPEANAERDIRYLGIVTGLVLVFLVGEVVAAIVGHSLVLFADAGHMLTDVAALGMSAWAIRLAQRPAQGRWTFGLQRAEIVSAAVNGVTLVAIGLLIGVEAIQRLISPPSVHGGLVLVVAIIGAVVNIVASSLLRRTTHSSLNLRGAYVHILTDLFAFLGTGLAGAVILLSRWERADAIASLFVVALIAKTSWGLLRDSGRILLQASPESLDLSDVRVHLTEVPHVLDVHDLHAWTVTSGLLTLSAHVVVEDHCFDNGHTPQILDALQKCLAGHFEIEHATFQLEPATHVTHEPGLHP